MSHGLYEIQILDSFGVKTLGVHDCGAIYERWINNKGVGGSIPLKNASRQPGEWQSFHVWFRAPRFDSTGKKTEDAKFLRVEHNGVSFTKTSRRKDPRERAWSSPKPPPIR